MGTILCTTRGGPDSYPNQDQAIQMAKERQEELIFLYVVDVHFLNHVSSPVLVDMETTLQEMGEFLMTMAKERAKKSGIQARSLVRSGSIRKALEEAVREHQVTTVTLGSPQQETGITTSKVLRDLADWLQNDLGVEVVLI